MNGTTGLRVHAIPNERLDRIRSTGVDGHGNTLSPFDAAGVGEPLRCCLRFADPGERITLISYAPFEHASVWREVGPVYIHAARCDGYATPTRLPPQLAVGPRVLRTYRGDLSMDYDHNTVTGDGDDLDPAIRGLLAAPGVSEVHVRTVAPQCFLYRVTR